MISTVDRVKFYVLIYKYVNFTCNIIFSSFWCLIWWFQTVFAILEVGVSLDVYC